MENFLNITTYNDIQKKWFNNYDKFLKDTL